MSEHKQVRLQLNRTQRRKLRRLLLDAWQNVPMYRSLYEAHGISRNDLPDPQVLGRLPILGKSQLLATPLQERVNRRFDMCTLAIETTTGSTGQPFSLCIDRRYRALRNLRFLRGLLSTGYRPWHTLLLLTDRHQGNRRRHNWHYQSVECPSGDIRETYERLRPDVLYGFMTPLRLLAENLLTGPPNSHQPRLVVSTAEMLDSATRTILERAFGCPVFDFYGMTEMGLVAWQRPQSDGYIMSQSAVVTELIADDSCHGLYRIVMTNLDLRASPIIRYDTGDLAFVDIRESRAKVMSFEGRTLDTIVRRDGSELSPYRITDALRDVPGVKRFKITQRDLNELAVDLEADPGFRSQAKNRIRSILDDLLGPDINLTFDFRDNLVPVGARKYRPIESRVRRP